MERDLDRLISALLERRGSGELRPDIKVGRLGYTASLVDAEGRRANARAAMRPTGVAADSMERLEQAVRLLRGMKAPAPANDPAPASEPAFAEAEAQLGSRLPDAMRRIYYAVANGGFGPGEGLLPIAAVVAETLKTRSDTQGVGVEWPGPLAIIQPPSPITHCLDCVTGEVIAWDGEGFTDLVWAGAPPSELGIALLDGFQVVSSSIEQWLWRWLDGPTEEEVAAFEATKARAFGEARENWKQRVEAYIVQLRGESAAERAKLGLKGDDWEELLRRDLIRE